MFKNCRFKAYLRYVEELVPIERDDTMYVGQLVHRWLQGYYSGTVAYIQVVDKASALAAAITTAYAVYWPNQEGWAWAKHQTERVFQDELRNPETGAASKTFVFGGKVDMLVFDKGWWLVEHKTTSAIDQGYIERLWCDSQIQIYTKYVPAEFQPLQGVIYNILRRPMLRPYEISSKRSEPETMEAYSERCQQDLLEKPGSFHRQELIFTPGQLEELEEELWDLSQEVLRARKGHWYDNKDNCWKFNKPCPYWRYCVSGRSQVVKESFYRHEPANQELSAEELAF
jgi:hypothetical protein